jgi:hypothetical protein
MNDVPEHTVDWAKAHPLQVMGFAENSKLFNQDACCSSRPLSAGVEAIHEMIVHDF